MDDENPFSTLCAPFVLGLSAACIASCFWRRVDVMSRKAKEVARAKSTGTYAVPRCLVASLGYSQLKPQELPSDIAIVLSLSEADGERPSRTLQEQLGQLLPAVQRVLMCTEASPPEAIFLVDCTPLIPTGTSPRSVLDAEGMANGPLGKQLGKPVGRLLEKMLAGYHGRVTLVTFGGGAQLALRMLQAAQNDHGFKEGAVDRLVLLHPRLSATAVNNLLAKPSKTQMVVDIYYESAAALEKRDAMVRHAYDRGTSRILAPDEPSRAHTVGCGLYVSLLSNRKGLREGGSEADMYCTQIDPEEADTVGKSVFWSELTFEMSRATKMHTAVLVDLDPYEIAQAVLGASAPPARSPRAHPMPSKPSTPRTPPLTTSASGAPCEGSPTVASLVGALVLRGNRCVLVRSLAAPPEWPGMRLPYVELAAGESSLDGAVRAASEYCDIDGPAELEVLPHIPPAVLYLEGRHSERRYVLVHVFYARQPPPDGPLEDADLTDEDDLYDWYTWPRAVHVLRKDPHVLSTLRTMACALAAAHQGGHLPSKFGGVFGQEFLAALTLPAAAPETVHPRDSPQSVAMWDEAADAGQASPASAPPASQLSRLEAKIDQILAAMAVGTAVAPPPLAATAACNEGSHQGGGGAHPPVVDGPLSMVMEAANRLQHESARPLPVTVLSGFLGSGKTTLVSPRVPVILAC